MIEQYTGHTRLDVWAREHGLESILRSHQFAVRVENPEDILKGVKRPDNSLSLSYDLGEARLDTIQSRIHAYVLHPQSSKFLLQADISRDYSTQYDPQTRKQEKKPQALPIDMEYIQTSLGIQIHRDFLFTNGVQKFFILPTDGSYKFAYCVNTTYASQGLVRIQSDEIRKWRLSADRLNDYLVNFGSILQLVVNAVHGDIPSPNEELVLQPN